jgi:putative Mn2+ efflux pump MntP
MYFFRRHAPWVSSGVLGVLLVIGGAYMIIEGFAVHDEIRDELRAEQIITSQDARIPGVLVDDAETARAQADVIKEHTLGTWGPYSELPREDPRRAQFIDGVTLRSALNTAVMGLGVTQLVIAVGVLVLVAGAATIILATPGLYLLAGMVVAQSRSGSVEVHEPVSSGGGGG